MARQDEEKARGGELSEWNVVWIKAIALAWKNAEFEAKLLSNARDALATYLNYSVPPGIDLKVVRVQTDDKEGFGWDALGQGGWALPQTVVTVPLPPKPKDVSDQAIALANLIGGKGGGSCGGTCCL
jgi:ribosomally synthesized peptide (two-chain TOMM family)